jgi:hypothetical protein
MALCREKTKKWSEFSGRRWVRRSGLYLCKEFEYENKILTCAIDTDGIGKYNRNPYDDFYLTSFRKFMAHRIFQRACSNSNILPKTTWIHEEKNGPPAEWKAANR